MDKPYACSVKSCLRIMFLTLPYKISTQKKSHLPRLISCSASCGP
ncbi:hypothetical protein T12_3498 [Trichinella patagoniensis]|uniref:Uncharacterized protein n=1 Tax=Trichinella patagoniensis TaxID=990121 RepID=A0A0V0ZCQ4_9BILA|nr:hypothetical protein T12_3498 [Trichinella patagoniensis]